MKKYTNIFATTALATMMVPGLAAAQTDLTYMMWGDPPEIAVWEQLVEAFQVEHPDINIAVEVSDWGTYWEKLLVQVAGGDAPDLFAMDAPIYPDWQARGALLDITPYLADSDVLDGIYAGPLSSYQLEAGTFGLPRDFQTIVMYYNKAMLDEAGLEYPSADWTLDDLRTTAAALTIDKDGDGNIDQWGIGTEAWDMEPFWGPVVFAHGGEIISEDFSTTLMTEGPARDAFDYINALIVEDKSIMSEENLESYGWDGFQAGVAAMTFSGHWVIPAYSSLDFDWAVAPFPSGPAGRATLVNSAGIVGSATTEHPDEVYEFMEFVVSEEGQSILASLGFAIPVNRAAASGPAYLEQTSPGDHVMFVDALEYARAKPAFRGYEEWSGLVGEPLGMTWAGEWSISEALDEIAATADDALGN
ncbi:carbohydrate ABC transporter substrate-binding protein, CUT1 family [Octadecabacter temperatus]|uniref:sn-glycerol-3-phosphate-binding periplasmic protein UgpB n=1 Tax=Octadecabacter temperatus TaxID=1458307 RepID=A0A0K0Y893_9RHOB|nr:sugar ABC transporter substrate-binding protein [Octadecabacter temperatus]AKS47082.1 Putative ABC transporter substrate-binding protein YesO [Octadecabacter temperatus]SIO46699.1 carbohydrate ABC transporter substrate-binding protein, CUT1 family [Octadecabacter temperatus]